MAKKRIPHITLTPKSEPSLDKLKHDLNRCREDFARSKTYHNALRLQQAETRFNTYFKKKREAFKLAYQGVPFESTGTPFTHYIVRDNVVYLVSENGEE